MPMDGTNTCRKLWKYHGTNGNVRLWRRKEKMEEELGSRKEWKYSKGAMS
jgi:hypothetical protein